MWGFVKQRVEVPKLDLKYFAKSYPVEIGYHPEGFSISFQQQSYDVRCVLGPDSYHHLLKVYCVPPQNLRFHTLETFNLRPYDVNASYYSTGYYDPENHVIVGNYSTEFLGWSSLARISGLIALNPKTKILKPQMKTIEKEFPNISIYVENTEYQPKLLIYDFKHENVKFIEVVEYDIDYIGIGLYHFLGFHPGGNKLYIYARHEGDSYARITYVRVKFNCVTIP